MHLDELEIYTLIIVIVSEKWVGDGTGNDGVKEDFCLMSCFTSLTNRISKYDRVFGFFDS